jgi:hypothetical protein
MNIMVQRVTLVFVLWTFILLHHLPSPLNESVPRIAKLADSVNVNGYQVKTNESRLRRLSLE